MVGKHSSILDAAVCSLAVLFTACGGVGANNIGAGTEPASSLRLETGTVVVDFGQPVPGQKSMSGFLHGTAPGHPPADSELIALAPRLWRGSVDVNVDEWPLWKGEFDLYDRVNSLNIGTVYQSLVSEEYGYPVDGAWNFSFSTEPPWDRAPYSNDYVYWEEYLQRLIAEHPNRNTQWDVWNEPNVTVFWRGHRSLFFETYRRAYVALRNAYGSNAVIGGPSITGYDKAYIQEFLDYCLANGCEVNFLSWHELDDSKITGIADRIKDARASFFDNPKYAPLKIREIQINEYAARNAHYRPGEIVAYLDQLERGGADAALKTCWPNSQGQDSCWDDSVDGLFSSNGEPRGTAWVYRIYARGVSTRVVSTSANSAVSAIASSGAVEGRATVLIGFFDDNNSPASPVDITITLSGLRQLPFLRSSSRVQIQIDEIPDSGEEVVSNPIQLNAWDEPLRNGTVNLTLEGAKLHHAYVITVSARR